jgi:O-antigen/teichoic acid export membrane protein
LNSIGQFQKQPKHCQQRTCGTEDAKGGEDLSLRGAAITNENNSAAAKPGLADAGRSLLGPAELLMAGRFLAFGITACLPFVLVRFLTQVEFGTYKQAFLISGTLSLISQLGIATSLYYFLPKAPAAGRYVCNTIVFLTIMSVGCIAALTLGRQPISAWLNNPGLANHLPSIGLMTAFIMISIILEIVMICRQRYLYASATYALSDGSRAICFLIPVFLGMGLRGLFIGAIIATGTRVAAMLVYFKHEFGNSMRPDAGLFKSQMNYALPFAGAILVEIVQRNYHQYFVSSHFDAATFAIYAAGCLTIPFIDFVATPSGDVMMVKMREAHANGDTQTILKLWHDTTRKLVLLFFPLVVFSMIVSRELIITLYTKTYAASIPIFAAWSLAIIFSAVLVDAVLRVYAETRFLLVNNLIKLCLTASLVGLFVRSFQLIGAVVVNLIATLVGRIVSLGRMKHVMKIRWIDVLPWASLGSIILISLTAGIPVILAKNNFQASPKVGLIIATLIYGVSYGALVFGFRLVPMPEISPLLRRFRRVRARFGLAPAAGQPEIPTSNT